MTNLTTSVFRRHVHELKRSSFVIDYSFQFGKFHLRKFLRHNLPISVEIQRINVSLLRFLKAGNETERYKEKQHDLASGLRAKSASRSLLQLKLFGIYITADIIFGTVILSSTSFWCHFIQQSFLRSH